MSIEISHFKRVANENSDLNLIELMIIDMTEGTEKFQGMLGKVICSGMKNNMEIVTNIGNGFTKTERYIFWLNKDEFIGKYIEVSYENITKRLIGSYDLVGANFIRLL